MGCELSYLHARVSLTVRDCFSDTLDPVMALFSTLHTRFCETPHESLVSIWVSTHDNDCVFLTDIAIPRCRGQGCARGGRQSLACTLTCYHTSFCMPVFHTPLLHPARPTEGGESLVCVSIVCPCMMHITCECRCTNRS
jgi:hypothetical protein